MVTIRDTIWDIEPHTKAKHHILEKYLQAWFPILSSRHKVIIFIDGFAGPGKYKGEEKGSPIIALETAMNHSLFDKLANITFIFIEKDKKRCNHLELLLKDPNLKIPKKFLVEIFESKFDETMNDLLCQIENEGLRLAPTFAFIDPFGYSDTPMDVIRRLMNHRHCEVFITFMCDALNRWCSQPNQKEHIDKLYGCADWHKVNDLSSGDRIPFLIELYVNQLHSKCNAKFVRVFEMESITGHLVYTLIFASKSIEGLKQMKRVMWKIDPTGQYKYSDRTNPNQITLLSYTDEREYMDKLKILITSKFSGKQVNVDVIEDFVWRYTPYCFDNVKKEILKPLEKDDIINVIESPRKKSYAYPNGTVIAFR